jgi:hypothetical protein
VEERHDMNGGSGGAANGAAVSEIVATEARPIERAPQSALPVPAAAATGGIVLAAATYLLVRILRRPARKRATLRVGRGRRGRGLEVTGSRSFLVDVHMLKR